MMFSRFTKNLTVQQKGIITMIGGFVIHLVMGSVFMWGQLNVYITSYYRQKSDTGLELSVGGAIFPVMMASVATGMPLGVKGIKWFGSARKSSAVSCIIATSALFISSYTEMFWQFILVYGIVQGIAIGSVYFVPLYMGYLFFPTHKGMVSGIITGGFAMCSFVFGYIFFALVNPEGLSQIKNSDGYSYFEGESLQVALNVPDTLRKMSFIYFGVSVTFSMLLMNYPNQIIPKQPLQPQIQPEILLPEANINDEGVNEMIAPSPITMNQLIIMTENTEGDLLTIQTKNKIPEEIKNSVQIQNEGAQTIKDAFLQPQLYMSLLVGILAIGFGLLINGNFKSVAKDSGYIKDSYQVLLGSMAGLGNGLSRPLWATLLDKFSFKQIVLAVLTISLVCSLTLQICRNNQVVYVIWVFIIQTTLGGILGMWPVLSVRLNGIQIGSQIYGIYWIGFSLANLIQFLIVLYLKNKIGFDNIFYIYSFQTFIAILLIIFYPLKVDWNRYRIQQYNKRTLKCIT